MFNVEKANAIYNCILNDHSLEEASEENAVSVRTIKRYIEALDDPNTNLYDAKKYKEIQEKLTGKKESQAEDRKKEQKQEYQNKVNIVIDCILENHTVNEAVEITGVSKRTVEKYIKALGDENSSVYDPERSKRVNRILEAFKKAQEEAKNEEYKENVRKVVACIKERHTIAEAVEITGFSESTVHNYIKALNDPRSIVYDAKTYEELKSIQEEVALERNRLGGLKGKGGRVSPVSMKRRITMANLLLQKDLTIEEASSLLDLPTSTLYDYLKSIPSQEIQKRLQEMFEKHKNRPNKKPEQLTKNHHPILLIELPENAQKEIVLVALTFRTSYKTLAKIFYTTEEDVKETFARFPELKPFLDYLQEETANEDATNTLVSFVKAKNYWTKRNQLIKKYNVAVCKDDEKESAKLKKELRKLRESINDTLLKKIVKKSFSKLTEKEKEYAARLPLKYVLSATKACEILHMRKENLQLCKEKLAEKDYVYAEKINCLDTIFQKANQKLAWELATRKNALTSLSTLVSESFEEEKRSRGGGLK